VIRGIRRRRCCRCETARLTDDRKGLGTHHIRKLLAWPVVGEATCEPSREAAFAALALVGVVQHRSEPRASLTGRSGLTIGAFSIVRREAPVTEERTTPLCERMIEDMRVRGMSEKSRKAHIRGVRNFAAFLGRAPDTGDAGGTAGLPASHDEHGRVGADVQRPHRRTARCRGLRRATGATVPSNSSA
jgi:hypothetical protein